MLQLCRLNNPVSYVCDGARAPFSFFIHYRVKIVGVHPNIRNGRARAAFNYCRTFCARFILNQISFSMVRSSAGLNF